MNIMMLMGHVAPHPIDRSISRINRPEMSQQDIIWNMLPTAASGETISSREVADAINVHINSVSCSIGLLVEAGHVVRFGKNREYRYARAEK